MTFTEELRQKIDAGLDITREEALALVNVPLEEDAPAFLILSNCRSSSNPKDTQTSMPTCLRISLMLSQTASISLSNNNQNIKIKFDFFSVGC